jgi:mono/diheme cytochrome c family protein
MSAATNQPAMNAPAADSKPQDPAVPIWLIIVLFMLLYWGAVYFDEHGGWFEKQVYAPYRNTEEVASINAAFGPEDPRVRGARIYAATCIACHQANGMGTPGTFPPLAGSDWVNEKEPGRMIRIVLQGFSGPGLMIKGQPFNTASSMVPWNSYSDEDLAAVITYVRSNSDWKNNASPVTPEQVHAIRAKVASHPMSFTPDEMMQISPAD